MKLELGCGITCKDTYIGIDILEDVKPHICMDIERFPLPFDDESVDHIRSRHVFEHLKNYAFVLSECHRVLKDTGSMYMILPYATSLGGDYEDHHIRPRYFVYKDFDISCYHMVGDFPQFDISRKLTFPWYTKAFEIINLFPRLRYIYENTGLRYLFPGHELHLHFNKIRGDA